MRPAILFAATIATSAGIVAASPTLQQAASFEAKMHAIIARGESQAAGHRTVFAGDEVNAYLQFRLAEKLPAGVAEPAVTMHDAGRVSGRAIVDLDGLRRRSSGGWFDPTAYLGGKLPVTATGTLKTSGGSGQFLLESADISGIPVPKTLLQELVTYYTRSADLPGGVDIDAPFQLPSRIQRIDVVANKATVVQ